MDSIKEKAYQKIAEAVKTKATTSLEDALFISKESRNLEHVKRFIKLYGQGMISHPMSWWATNIQIMAYLGSFGKNQQRLAILRQSIFSSLISSALANPFRTGNFIYWFKSTQLENSLPSFLGRVTGGVLITNKVILNRKIRPNIKKGITTTGLIFTTRLVHVSYGQAMLAIAEGIMSLENILFSMITGVNAKLDSNFYHELEHLNVDQPTAYDEYINIQAFLLKLSYMNTQTGYNEYKYKIFG